MSYTLTPVAVDLDQVRAAIGSKDKALLAKLKKAFASDLEQIDELLEDVLDEDDDPAAAADTLRHLVFGEPLRDDLGFAYGYALGMLCGHFGRTLPNDEWSAMRGDWFETVQKVVAKAGVPKKAFEVSRLAFRGSPVPLPEIDDFPFIGYLTRGEITAARKALGEADFKAAKNPEAVAAITQIQSWLDACAAKKRDLVCFYA